MKTKEFAFIGRKLLLVMPGYASKGYLIFAQPVQQVVRGIGFDGSSFDPKVIYSNVFFQPLFVPLEHFTFGFGFRLRNAKGVDGWYSDDPVLIDSMMEAVVEKALPFLNQIATLPGVLQEILKRPQENPHVLEAAAYCCALLDETEKALHFLGLIYQRVNKAVEWQDKLASRAKLIEGLILNDPQKARKKLQEWEAYTVQHVGLGGHWLKESCEP